MSKKILLSLCLVYMVCFCSTAQRTQNDPRTPETSTTPRKSTFKSQKIFYGEPGKAALYSLIIPGAGQLYNKRWWKVPLVYALEGSAVYLMINNIDFYNQWNNCYIDLVNGTNPSTFCGTIDDRSTAFRIRDSARRNRELSFIFMGLAHLLNVVEAFVDRHLINFDTTDDLTFQSPPIPMNSQITLARIVIPLNNHSTRMPSLKPTR